MLLLTRGKFVALSFAGACALAPAAAQAALCYDSNTHMYVPCPTGTGPTAITGATNAVTAQIQENTSSAASPTGQPGSSQPIVSSFLTCGASYSGCNESSGFQSSCQSKTSTCVTHYSDGTESSKTVIATPPAWDDPSSAGSGNADQGAYPD